MDDPVQMAKVASEYRALGSLSCLAALPWQGFPALLGQGGHLDLQPSQESILAPGLPETHRTQSWQMSPRGAGCAQGRTGLEAPGGDMEGLPRQLCPRGPLSAESPPSQTLRLPFLTSPTPLAEVGEFRGLGAEGMAPAVAPWLPIVLKVCFNLVFKRTSQNHRHLQVQAFPDALGRDRVISDPSAVTASAQCPAHKLWLAATWSLRACCMLCPGQGV